MSDALNMAVIGIGSIGFMPLAVTLIGSAIRARREYRRREMLNRFADRVGI